MAAAWRRPKASGKRSHSIGGTRRTGDCDQPLQKAPPHRKVAGRDRPDHRSSKGD
jgi:hypothetical protein